jgi:hypothetical protein
MRAALKVAPPRPVVPDAWQRMLSASEEVLKIRELVRCLEPAIQDLSDLVARAGAGTTDEERAERADAYYCAVALRDAVERSLTDLHAEIEALSPAMLSPAVK